ncbi:MAG TPA: DsbA family protein [Thermoplasmata archaeon]
MAARIHVVWYTDPHNIWCWGCEPMVRRLQVVYPDAVEVEVRMGGLFEDFTPVREQWARMSGGRWTASVLAFFEAVAEQHRMPMNSQRMIENVDDFDSTWPACIAVKAAELQGRDAAARYLRALREAWCLDGRPIHRRGVQIEVASESGLDPDAFETALEDGRAENAFRNDREECERHEVTGFPTFEITRDETTARINGWQPWEVLEDVLRKVDADVVPKVLEPTEKSVLAVLRRYDRCATREIAAILGVTDDDAELLLEDLEGRGRVSPRTVGNGLVWEAAQGIREAEAERDRAVL